MAAVALIIGRLLLFLNSVGNQDLLTCRDFLSAQKMLNALTHGTGYVPY